MSMTKNQVNFLSYILALLIVAGVTAGSFFLKINVVGGASIYLKDLVIGAAIGLILAAVFLLIKRPVVLLVISPLLLLAWLLIPESLFYSLPIGSSALYGCMGVCGLGAVPFIASLF